MIFIKLILVSSIIGVYVMFLVYSVRGSLWVCVGARHSKWCMRKLCLLSHVLPEFL